MGERGNPELIETTYYQLNYQFMMYKKCAKQSTMHYIRTTKQSSLNDALECKLW